MSPPTKLYGACTGHKSIRSCDICRPIAAYEASKRWRNKRTPEEYQRDLKLSRASKRRSAAKKLAKNPPICPLCGKEPRLPRHRFGVNCARESIDYSRQKSYRKMKKNGWKPNARQWYLTRVAKYGKEELARKAREAYHKRKGKKSGTRTEDTGPVASVDSGGDSRGTPEGTVQQ